MIATVGGGSVTDAAKAVQVCLSNDVTTPRTSAPESVKNTTGADSKYGLKKSHALCARLSLGLEDDDVDSVYSVRNLS